MRPFLSKAKIFFFSIDALKREHRNDFRGKNDREK